LEGKVNDVWENHKDTKNTKIFYLIFVSFVSLWFSSLEEDYVGR
jgi:hypothetical protein